MYGRKRMANVLFGGIDSEENNGLVLSLREHHEITYRTHPEKLFYELNRAVMHNDHFQYDAVVYDLGLKFPTWFIGNDEFGKNTLPNLLQAKAPILLLSDVDYLPAAALCLNRHSIERRIEQLQPPYTFESVVDAVNGFFRS
jgi:hypothetical protein